MHSTNFLKATLAAGVSAGLLLSATPFALAEHDRDRTRATSAPRATERAYTAPRAVERTYAAPRPVERAYAAQRPVERRYRPIERTYVAPRPVEHTSVAPRPVERTYRPIERTIAAPRRIKRTLAPPMHVERAAPLERLNVAPRRTFAMPVHREQRAQVHAMPRERFVNKAPFVQRITPRRIEARENNRTGAPFREVVRLRSPRVTRFTTVRQVVSSPLMRAVNAPRTRMRVVYHPAYLTGRVIRIRRRIVVLQPPFGQQIFVNAAALPRPVAYLPVNSYVTVPVTYANGMYSLYTPPGYAYNAYGYNGYPYAGYNGYAYPYGAGAYCNGGSSLMYAALLPTVLSAISGGGNLNPSDLASLALTAVASGSSSCYPGYDPYGAYGAAPVYNNYPGNYSPYPVYNSYSEYGSYATPYDNCAWGDNGGDESNCATNFGGGYPGYGGYGLQQMQGLVVGRTGSMLMVLTGNGMSPTFVNAAPAFQNGYSVNGPVAVGQVIDAYGFYNGNTFVATSIV